MLLDETRAKARDWRLAILLIADDAVPAAERLKNVAPGRKPGVRLSGDAEPRKGRKTLRRVFRPYGAEFNTNTNPGLAPGATFLSRSAAFPSPFGSLWERVPAVINRRYSSAVAIF